MDLGTVWKRNVEVERMGDSFFFFFFLKLGLWFGHKSKSVCSCLAESVLEACEVASALEGLRQGGVCGRGKDWGLISPSNSLWPITDHVSLSTLLTSWECRLSTLYPFLLF